MRLELVRLAVARLVVHADRLGLDRDPALAFEVHRVEHLARIERGSTVCVISEDAVGQRRLPMVDVGDDREIADVVLRGHGAASEHRSALSAQPPEDGDLDPLASGMRIIRTIAAYDAKPVIAAADTEAIWARIERPSASSRTYHVPYATAPSTTEASTICATANRVRPPSSAHAARGAGSSLAQRHPGTRHRGADHEAGDAERLVEREAMSPLTTRFAVASPVGIHGRWRLKNVRVRSRFTPAKGG
jgi:hypothetical protein